jgi:hypothetical protein
MQNTECVVVRLNRDLRERVQRAADANDRSVSAEVRRLLTQTYSANKTDAR